MCTGPRGRSRGDSMLGGAGLRGQVAGIRYSPESPRLRPRGPVQQLEETMNFLKTLFFTITILLPPLSFALTAKPQAKYVPQVTPILASHQYFRSHPAASFWKLMPYYVTQNTDSACSLATAVMIVNAAQAGSNHTLATQTELIKRVHDKAWAQGVKENGMGASLDQLKVYLKEALHAYGIRHFTITLVHTSNRSPKTALALHRALQQANNGHSFMIANFQHKLFTGAESVGHFSPIGAYDEGKKRVLIMDPYRKLYEPYWVPEDLLLKAMVTRDKEADKYRGYLIVQLGIEP